MRKIGAITLAVLFLVNNISYSLCPELPSNGTQARQHTRSAMLRMAEQLFAARVEPTAVASILRTFIYSTADAERLSTFADLANDINKKYKKVADGSGGRVILPHIVNFYKSVIHMAVKLPNDKTAKGLQIMAQQALNIISWINNNVRKADLIRLTADESKMLKAGDKDRGPSYLEKDSFPVPTVDAEGGMGAYWRGVEGISKLGENIVEEAIFSNDTFTSAKDKALLYAMDHGFLKVPESIQGLTRKDEHGQGISTIHETAFLRDFLPGSIQHTSTGPGHFQGLQMDLKYVTEGEGIQYNKFYNAEGKLVAVHTQHLKRGTWAVAFAGAVDSMENLGGLRFNDISIRLSKEKANEILKSIDSSLEIGALLKAKDKITRVSKANPYVAVTAGRKSALYKRIEDAPDVIWTNGLTGGIFDDNTLIGLYRQLTPDMVITVSDSIAEFVKDREKYVMKDEAGEKALRVMDNTVEMELELEKMKTVNDYKEEPFPIGIKGKIKPYPWGCPYFIPELLGIDNTDKDPYAELWMGAHPDGPAQTHIFDREMGLDKLIDGAGDVMLGPEVSAAYGGKLPYLFKVLTADKALSIQAHPTKEQAETGYAKEKGDGPNYKDANHKPEIACALTRFWAMLGFRAYGEIAVNFELLNIPEFKDAFGKFNRDIEKALDVGADQGGEISKRALKDFYQAIMKRTQEYKVAEERDDMETMRKYANEIDTILEKVIADVRTRLSNELDIDRHSTVKDFVKKAEEMSTEVDLCRDLWVLRLNEQYPYREKHDIGILSPYLLNIVRLEPGEAIYLPAGELHAYLGRLNPDTKEEGAIMELMANSNNVLRGGLTGKRVDVRELLKTLTFESGRPEILKPEKKPNREQVYETTAEEFELSVIDLKQNQACTLPAGHSADALIVLEGMIEVVDSDGKKLSQTKGASFMIPASSGEYTITAKSEKARVYKASVPMDKLSARVDRESGVLLDALMSGHARVSRASEPAALGEELSADEKQPIMTAVNVMREETMEILLAQSMKLTNAVEETLDEVGIGYEYVDDASLIKNLKRREDKRKIILSDGTLDAEIEDLMKSDETAKYFKGVRLLSVEVAGGYWKMTTNSKDRTYHQSRLVMMAVLARLLNEDKTPDVREALKAIIQPCFEGDVNAFLDELAVIETDATKPSVVRKRISFFLENIVSWTEKLGRELRVIEFFWKYA